MGGVEIPNGAVADYDTVWSFGVLAGSTNLVSTMIANVNAELVFDGLVINNYNAGNFNFFLDGNLSAHLQIANQSGQELDETDLNAQLADAVASAGGTWVSGNVSGLTTPSTGTNTGSGQVYTPTTSGTAQQQQQQTAKPASATHQCGDPTWSWYQDLPQAISCMETKLLGTMGLLFIGLIIGVVLIVAGPAAAKAGAKAA